MRNISFALTLDQVSEQIKTVTRRLGWRHAKAGQVLQPVDKVMGFRPGQHPVFVADPIRVVSVRRERLDRMVTDPAYGAKEAALEGFPSMTGAEFVAFLCAANRCRPSTWVTRIEFAYVVPKP